MATIAVGDRAPRFTLSGAGGASIELAHHLRLGPVLLLFLKEGCGTSDLAAPIVETLWNGFRGHKSPERTELSVIGVVQESVPVTTEYVARFGLTFPAGSDEDLAVSRAYDIAVTPTLVLLRGRERLRFDADTIAEQQSARVVDVVEGWSRELYIAVADEIAARVGALPLEDLVASEGVPAAQPG